VKREKIDIGPDPKEKRRETTKKRSSTIADRCPEKVRARKSGYRFRGLEYG
jgi:hypothetical protein